MTRYVALTIRNTNTVVGRSALVSWILFVLGPSVCSMCYCWWRWCWCWYQSHAELTSSLTTQTRWVDC